jgi:hypothetical protein
MRLGAEVLTPAINALRSLADVRDRTEKLIAQAENEKREASALRAVLGEIEAMRQWAKTNKLPAID